MGKCPANQPQTWTPHTNSANTKSNASAAYSLGRWPRSVIFIWVCRLKASHMLYTYGYIRVSERESSACKIIANVGQCRQVSAARHVTQTFVLRFLSAKSPLPCLFPGERPMHGSYNYTVCKTMCQDHTHTRIDNIFYDNAIDRAANGQAFGVSNQRHRHTHRSFFGTSHAIFVYSPTICLTVGGIIECVGFRWHLYIHMFLEVFVVEDSCLKRLASLVA